MPVKVSFSPKKRWEALFWVWDRSSGLNRVEVSSGGRRSKADTGVYYRYYVVSTSLSKD